MDAFHVHRVDGGVRRVHRRVHLLKKEARLHRALQLNTRAAGPVAPRRQRF